MRQCQLQRARLNHGLRDAQNVYALTKVGTVLKMRCFRFRVLSCIDESKYVSYGEQLKHQSTISNKSLRRSLRRYYRKIHCPTSEFRVKFHAKYRYCTNPGQTVNIFLNGIAKANKSPSETKPVLYFCAPSECANNGTLSKAVVKI